MCIKGIYLNIIKTIYNKIIASVIWKALPLNLGTKHGCPLFLLLTNRVLEVLTTAIRQEKGIKSIQIGREEVKLTLFADDMLLHIENPKVSTPKQLELVNKFSKVEGYIIHATSKLLVYLC